MPPKREAVAIIAPVAEVKAAPPHPLIVAAHAQRDKWVQRVSDARTRIDECAVQIRRTEKSLVESEAAIEALLVQATDLIYPKEIKEVPLPAIVPVAGGKPDKDKGKASKASIVAPPVVAEPVAPPPPVLTEAQLRKKAKLQAAVLNAYKRKKTVAAADEFSPSPSHGGAGGESAAADDGSLISPRTGDIRPSKPNEVKPELWEGVMKLRDMRVDTEDRIAAFSSQLTMLRQRMTSLVEMERVTKYAHIGSENDVVVTVARVEEMQRIAKEQAKLEMESKQSRPQSSIPHPSSLLAPSGSVNLGVIKNAPVVATSHSPRGAKK